MRLQDRPRFRASTSVRFAAIRASRAAPRRCARSRSRGSRRPTVACSTRARHRPRAPATAVRRARARLRDRRPRARRMDRARGRAAPRRGRPVPDDAGRTRTDDAARARARRARGATRSSTHPTCATRSSRGDHQRDVRDGDHLGRVRGVPRRGDRGDARRDEARVRRRHASTCRFTHAYPDGPAPYYTVLAPGRPREPARAVGRDQAGGERGALAPRRHDHAPPRRRPRPPAVVRPPAPRALRGRAARGEGRARPGRHPEPGRADRSDAPVSVS